MKRVEWQGITKEININSAEPAVSLTMNITLPESMLAFLRELIENKGMSLDEFCSVLIAIGLESGLKEFKKNETV
jgi:hypothetical protein